MTMIRTTCPRCGDVDIGPAAILLHARRGDHEGTYSFTCPACMDDVEKRADRTIVALLISAGVDLEDRSRHPSHIGRDRTEPGADEPHPRGPVFTLDDLIDFHFLLEDDLYVEESLQSFV
jgi:predicted RNA-binding Zn-ribbon protein involved in translation (DUF1610 family)